MRSCQSREGRRSGGVGTQGPFKDVPVEIMEIHDIDCDLDESCGCEVVYPEGETSMLCERGEESIRGETVAVRCERCGERDAVLLDLRDHMKWCDECWRWRWTECPSGGRTWVAGAASRWTE